VDEGDGDDVVVSVSVDVADGDAVGDMISVVVEDDSVSLCSADEGESVVDDDDGDGDEVM